MWKTSVNKELSNPPSKLSFSALLEIEKCPRQWVLARANYPEIWGYKGFPPHINLSSINGQAIHRALGTVIMAFSKHHCISVNDPKTISVLKQLGGYTNILQESLGNITENYRDNPRFERNKNYFINKLQEDIPRLRPNLQCMLANLKPPFASYPSLIEKQNFMNDSLTPGSYLEIKIKPEEMGWVGIADLMNISDDFIEIVDFKTGGFHEEHILQIRIYCLLWTKDKILNPKARTVNKLTLCYSSGNVDVAVPSSIELGSLEKELSDRRQMALNAIKSDQPKAIPNDHCQWCDVRHLCDDYWNQLMRKSKRISGLQNQKYFGDLQIRITKIRNLLTCEGTVEASEYLGSSSPILMHMTINANPWAAFLTENISLRILNASVETYKNEIVGDVVIISTTEIFLHDA